MAKRQNQQPGGMIHASRLLAQQLEQKGFKTRCLLATRNDNISYVLGVRGDQEMVIRCRRYAERTDPAYLAAFERAINLGQIGRNYVLTFDGERKGSKGAIHAYTLHIAANRGDTASVTAYIMDGLGRDRRRGRPGVRTNNRKHDRE